MENLAAKRALTSTGVIGLSSLLLTKLFGIDLKVSLPVGMATGLTVDYYQTLDSYKKSIRIVSGTLSEYENKLNNGSPFMDALMTGVLAVLALSKRNLVIGAARDLFAIPPPPPPDDDDDDDDNDDDPDLPGVVRYSAAAGVRRTWNCLTRLQLGSLFTNVAARTLENTRTSLLSVLSTGALVSAPPTNDARAYVPGNAGEHARHCRFGNRPAACADRN